LYSAYKSKESLGASVAKKICNVKLVGDLAYFGNIMWHCFTFSIGSAASYVRYNT